MSKTALLAEFFLIFITPPLLIIWGPLPKEAIMPVLWIVSFYAYLHLRSSGIRVGVVNFERKDLYVVVLRFIVVVVAMTLFVIIYTPDIFLAFVKAAPLRWLLVMLLYPFLSAYLQEILFRSFFFHRYKKLFKGHALYFVIINAMVFAYVHIVFENWIAVIFTFFGGLLFAQTYLKTRSTMLTAIEHALYGNALYTLGLGYYFYHGANL